MAIFSIGILLTQFGTIQSFRKLFSPWLFVAHIAFWYDQWYVLGRSSATFYSWERHEQLNGRPTCSQWKTYRSFHYSLFYSIIILRFRIWAPWSNSLLFFDNHFSLAFIRSAVIFNSILPQCLMKEIASLLLHSKVISFLWDGYSAQVSNLGYARSLSRDTNY